MFLNKSKGLCQISGEYICLHKSLYFHGFWLAFLTHATIYTKAIKELNDTDDLENRKHTISVLYKHIAPNKEIVYNIGDSTYKWKPENT